MMKNDMMHFQTFRNFIPLIPEIKNEFKSDTDGLNKMNHDNHEETIFYYVDEKHDMKSPPLSCFDSNIHKL